MKAVLVLAVAVAALVLMGRPLWCACGSPVPWAADVWSAHNSQHLVDAYTLTHVSHGFILYCALSLVARRWTVAQRALAALALECGWEVLENSTFVIERYRAATISLAYYGDSLANSLGDIGACMVGFYVAARLPAWGTAVVFVALEVLLALMIRDGLLLNVVMLLYPLEWVRRWQMGM